MRHISIYFLLGGIITLVENEKNDMAVIDWDQGMEKWTDKPNIKMSDVNTVYQWKVYIHYIIQYRILKNYNLRELYLMLAEPHKCLILRNYSYQLVNQTLSGPCHAMFFTTRMSGNYIWWITVHKSFMTNITIEKAYVPYSQLCTLTNTTSMLSVHEGHVSQVISCRETCSWINLPIEYLSGHIYMHYVYTKKHKATLLVRVSPAIYTAPFPTSLIASYQIHGHGFAYLFADNIVTPQQWNISLLPSQLLFTHGMFHYIWYIANAMGLESYTHFEAILSLFQCSRRTSSVSIYPALLSSFLMKWKVHPITIFYCNLTETQRVNITFHMYATVTLSLSVFEEPIKINMAFEQHRAYVNTNPIPVNAVIDAGAMHSVEDSSTSLQFAYYKGAKTKRLFSW